MVHMVQVTGEILMNSAVDLEEFVFEFLNWSVSH